jgi:hypothetical protein
MEGEEPNKKTFMSKPFLPPPKKKKLNPFFPVAYPIVETTLQNQRILPTENFLFGPSKRRNNNFVNLFKKSFGRNLRVAFLLLKYKKLTLKYPPFFPGKKKFF